MSEENKPIEFLQYLTPLNLPQYEIKRIVPTILRDIRDGIDMANKNGIDCGYPDEITITLECTDSVINFTVPFSPAQPKPDTSSAEGASHAPIR